MGSIIWIVPCIIPATFFWVVKISIFRRIRMVNQFFWRKCKKVKKNIWRGHQASFFWEDQNLTEYRQRMELDWKRDKQQELFSCNSLSRHILPFSFSFPVFLITTGFSLSVLFFLSYFISLPLTFPLSLSI